MGGCLCMLPGLQILQFCMMAHAVANRLRARMNQTACALAQEARGFTSVRNKVYVCHEYPEVNYCHTPFTGAPWRSWLRMGLCGALASPTSATRRYEPYCPVNPLHPGSDVSLRAPTRAPALHTSMPVACHRALGCVAHQCAQILVQG